MSEFKRAQIDFVTNISFLRKKGQVIKLFSGRQFVAKNIPERGELFKESFNYLANSLNIIFEKAKAIYPEIIKDEDDIISEFESYFFYSSGMDDMKNRIIRYISGTVTYTIQKKIFDFEKALFENVNAKPSYILECDNIIKGFRQILQSYIRNIVVGEMVIIMSKAYSMDMERSEWTDVYIEDGAKLGGFVYEGTEIPEYNVSKNQSFTLLRSSIPTKNDIYKEISRHPYKSQYLYETVRELNLNFGSKVSFSSSMYIPCFYITEESVKSIKVVEIDRVIMCKLPTDNTFLAPNRDKRINFVIRNLDNNFVVTKSLDFPIFSRDKLISDYDFIHSFLGKKFEEMLKYFDLFDINSISLSLHEDIIFYGTCNPGEKDIYINCVTKNSFEKLYQDSSVVKTLSVICKL